MSTQKAKRSKGRVFVDHLSNSCQPPHLIHLVRSCRLSRLLPDLRPEKLSRTASELVGAPRLADSISRVSLHAFIVTNSFT